MKILFASSEVVPFAKTGGLADVAAALPKALHKIGHDVRVFLPLYKFIDREKFGLKQAVEGVFEAKIPGTEVIVYFFDDHHFSKRDELYGLNGKDYSDNFEAFLAFCNAALPFVKQVNWRPDVIHGNDWQTGPLVYLTREARQKDPYFQRTAAVYSIHNLAYQGGFPEEKAARASLPGPCFARLGLEYADLVNTVSETYAQEIQTREYGCGLEGTLKKLGQDLHGILNGVDYELWNPATDKKLFKRYSRMTLSLKVNNKNALQEKMGLEIDDKIPLLAITSRLDKQKGFDLLLEIIDDILGLGCQLIVLGAGDPYYQELLVRLKDKHPKGLGLKLGFDADLAQQIYGGADIFLMPSRYEPCGLGQLISFKYGVIPVVRRTGGLADTVKDYDLKTRQGSGFVFDEYKPEALLDAVKRAVDLYKKHKAAWKDLQQTVMEYDYSWDASAKKYIALYSRAADKVIG